MPEDQDVPLPDRKQAESTTALTEAELVKLIETEGRPPLEYVLSHVDNGVRIIGIGEMHGEPPMETIAVDIIRGLAEKSHVPIGTIALEINDDMQPSIDGFLQGEEELPESVGLGHTPKFKEVFEFAKSKGIPIACVDSHKDKLRDVIMHQRVQQIHEKHPGKLTVFYVGGGHLGEYKGLYKTQEGYLNGLPEFIGINQKYIDGVEEPKILPSNTNEAFKNTPQTKYSMPWDNYSDYDATVFHPLRFPTEKPSA